MFERRVDLKDLRSGQYQIEVEYYASKLLNGCKENLKTNSIPFKIER
jgi:hypothetical protein